MSAAASLIKFDDEATWPARWIDRCEIIAQDMSFRHRETGEVIKRTASEVFNYSPTGELMMIHFWFSECVARREGAARLAAGEDFQAIYDDISARYERLMPPTGKGIVTGPVVTVDPFAEDDEK